MATSPRYPLAETLQKIIIQKQLSRGQFIESIGYKNVNSGIRHLDRWLSEGVGDPLMIERIKIGHPEFSNEIDLTLEATKELKGIEYAAKEKARIDQMRRDHLPCLVVDTAAARPSQIAFYALVGRRFKVIPLPRRLATIDEDRAVRVISWLIGRYLKKFGGACPFWGPVTGFTFSRKADQLILFDRDARIAGRKTELPRVLLAQAILESK